jgi:hypothetical protein
VGDTFDDGKFEYTVLTEEDSTGSVSVSRMKNDDLSGDAVIPSLVTSGERSYRVTTIADRAFIFCSSLTSIMIPVGVTAIGEYAFSECSSLTSIGLPENLTSMGKGAFSSCSGLSSIVIPDGVAVIGEYAFADCSSLEKIVVGPVNKSFLSIEGVLFDKS